MMRLITDTCINTFFEDATNWVRQALKIRQSFYCMMLCLPEVANFSIATYLLSPPRFCLPNYFLLYLLKIIIYSLAELVAKITEPAKVSKFFS